jgi:hypothetical protein
VELGNDTAVRICDSRHAIKIILLFVLVRGGGINPYFSELVITVTILMKINSTTNQ